MNSMGLSSGLGNDPGREPDELDMEALDRPSAIVTGASGGVGAAVTKLFRRRGYQVVAVGRRAEPLTALAADDPGITVVVADVSDPAAPQHIVDETLAAYGRIDVIVNNAGRIDLLPLAATPDDVIESSFAVNCVGPMRLIREAWDSLSVAGGTVINVTSMATIDPFPGFGAYAAAKSALASLTRTVAGEGADEGIEAWTIAPGAIETGMLRSLFAKTVIAPDQTLDPADVAAVVVEAALRERPEKSGSEIVMNVDG